MSETEPGFVFALTNPGSENALKLEVTTLKLPWQASYQRKGFVSFKVANLPGTSPQSVIVPPLACALRRCVSLGRASTRDEAASLIENHPSYRAGQIHFLRTLNGWGEREAEAALESPRLGECVGTILQLAEKEFWAGIHWHGPFLSPDPGGETILRMPVDSPSRAWLKLEEAVRFFGLQFSTKDVVVELGCAPGGVVLALLRRGVSVIGVDPAAMAEVIAGATVVDRHGIPQKRPWFFHCRKPAALTSRRDLGAEVTWFMSDMNQTPEVVLAECARFCKMAASIRNVLITLKLTDLTRIAEQARWHEALAALGFKSIHLQQFSVHHKEFALLATK